MASSNDGTKPDGSPTYPEDGEETFPSTLETRTVDDHQDDDPEDVEEVPEQVGRYRVEGIIGRGGMGIVFRAHDPELDRDVALKLLRLRAKDERRVDRARKRLLREAQALAQLSHPNVVAVHDVGQFGRDVFIAMELVEGRTLRDLVRARVLTREELIALFVAAGRGLAAAHSAGLIHRDFKPSNVIVGEDGRPRVLDFGLARAASSLSSDSLSGEEPPTDPSSGPGIDSDSKKLISARLTQLGMTVGTPAYMAPEQKREGLADERTDQYSFCLALFEAVTGELPTGKDLANRRASLDRARVPRWLRRVLLRGANQDRLARYPSMDALLSDLGRDIGARRRAVALVSAIALLGGVTVWSLAYRGGQDPGARCAQVGADLDGVWDDGSRAGMRAAFLATESKRAPETFILTTERLDDYAARWIEQRRGSCEAYHTRGALSAKLYDLRAACLERRRSALRATVRVLSASVDEAVLDEAPRAAGSMPRLEDCLDDRALQAARPLPDAPEARQRVEALQRELDDGEALLSAGKVARGLELVAGLLDEARAVAHPPLTAQVLLTMGNMQLEHGEHEAAEQTLRDATMSAAEAGDHEPEARAWVLRMRGKLLQGRFDEAAAMREAVETAVVRAGRSAALRSEFHYTMAWLMVMKDDTVKALDHAERALALRIEAVGEKDAQVALAHIMLGNALILEGEPERAAQEQEKAIETLTASLGPSHPDVGSALHNLATAQISLGEAEKALPTAERALAISTDAFGAEHPRTACELALVGEVHHASGDHPRARSLVARAVALLERDPGANPAGLAHGTRTLADIAAAQGDRDEALSLYDKAIERYSELFGPDDAAVAEIKAARDEL